MVTVVSGVWGFVFSSFGFRMPGSPWWTGLMIGVTAGMLAGVIGAFAYRTFSCFQRDFLAFLIGPSFLCGLVAFIASVLSPLGLTTVAIEFGLDIRSPAMTIAFVVGPMSSTLICAVSLCWYYQATHGGRPLLNFLRRSDYDVAPSSESKDSAT